MSFKDFIKESIIDIPRRRYAMNIFDDNSILIIQN